MTDIVPVRRDPVAWPERPRPRRKAPKPISVFVRLARTLGFTAVLVLAIVFAWSYTRPIYTGRAPLVQQITKSSLSKAPPSLEKLLSTPEYARDRQAFAADLVRTGRMSQARADSIATVAVREAYLKGISPAIIFGVMLTENARFISGAQSNVGAIGLMQVYPKVWLSVLGDSLGTNLGVDSTNLQYGVNILNRYFYPRNKDGSRRHRDYRTALLRYNGCVKGTNTHNCHTYPDKVQSYIETSAVSICAGKNFYECIARPFLAGFLGDPTIQ